MNTADEHTAADKQALRQLMRSRLRAQPPDDEARWSAEAISHIKQLPTAAAAHTALLYHPIAHEVDLRPLIDEWYAQGRRIVLPEVADDGLLRLRLYEGRQSLRRGAYGIMEPTGALLTPADYAEICLAIVPGLSFDDRGYRLGRGRGYYDRLLPHLPHATLVGLAYACQRTDRVPTEPQDVRMHTVVFAGHR